MPLSSDKHIIDEQFSKALRNYKSQPSGRVWTRVWNRLSANEHETRKSGKLLLIALLVLIGGAGITVTSVLAPGSKDRSKIQHLENPLFKNSNADAPATAAMSNTSMINAKKKLGEKNIVFENVPVITSQTSPAEIITFYDKNGSEISSGIILNETSSVPFAWTDDNSFMNPLESSSPVFNEHENAKKKERLAGASPYPKGESNTLFYVANVTGFYLGFGQNVNSTWILDHDAIASENLKYKPTFGSALMAQGGYNFSNKWGLEAAWVFHSDEGQRYQYLPEYNRTTSLEYSQKHISFNYMHVPVMMRYKVQGWSGVTETPIFVNYSLGLQYGRMLSYSIDETKEKISENHLFRKNEYAVVAGLDYDFITNKAAFFSIGIRTSFGTNLFIKDVPEDLEFDSPHNVLIGIHGAINFSLKKIPAH